MMCSVMNSRGSKIRMAGKAPSSHLQSVPSSNKSSAANSALNDNGNKNMYICTFACNTIYVIFYLLLLESQPNKLFKLYQLIQSNFLHIFFKHNKCSLTFESNL